jgi:two-component system, OmpR family, sensor histidine kinase PhoQ
MSIQARLLLAASAVLVIFIGLCGAGLETAFRQAALDAEETRLRGLVYALLGAADQNERNQLELNDGDLPEPKLSRKDSGLEAAVLDESGVVLWRSPSQKDILPVVIGPDVGRWKFERLEGDGRFALSFGLRWIGEHNVAHRYSVVVLEDAAGYDAQLAVFRRTLWAWLLAAAAALLLVLLLLQRWGLLPLARLVRELQNVESGAQPHIEAPYPQELMPLTGALNAMIVSERGQLARYRNALGDLAHSLKTPLAVLRGIATDTRLPDDSRRQLEEQLGHMQQITDHQLTRAAAAGRRALAQPVAVRPLVEKLVGALKKVYATKRVSFENRTPADLVARADSGDLLELMGNVLDNAAKWAKCRVRAGATREQRMLTVIIEDDGPGFPEDAQRLLGRGVRADTRVPGQGLGLAAVAEIMKGYEGELTLERSPDLGGARVILKIPGA